MNEHFFRMTSFEQGPGQRVEPVMPGGNWRVPPEARRAELPLRIQAQVDKIRRPERDYAEIIAEWLETKTAEVEY